MSDSAIALAQRQFLSSGLDLSMVERALGALLGPGVDGADLYFQHTRHEGWGLEDGIVKEGSHNIEQGVGVRAVSGEKVGFAYSDAIDAPALMEAACSARAIARSGGSGALSAPAGTMSVVLGPGWPGILLHEAIGHGLEGDFNRKGSSAFAGRIGQQVASRGVTVVDDGTLPNRRGSLTVDDEGNPTRCTTLIEDGILVGYMQDSLNARLMGVAPTGNGRRESFAHLPMPRMTNTYMLNGGRDPEEIIRSVKKGLYAVNFGGGQVDITSGKFVFSGAEVYMIENGKVTYPIKGATLIGNGPDALTRVSMIGNDMALDSGVGTCGKEGQSVPVGVGQPTLRIDGLTVGGKLRPASRCRSVAGKLARPSMTSTLPLSWPEATSGAIAAMASSPRCR
jgi:predicted Zn-dependent protease